MKKRTFSLIAVAAALIIGGVYLTTRSAAGQASSTLAANAQTAAVTRTTLYTSVDSTGSLIPEAEVNLAFGSSGTVEEVKVEVGDSVKQGDSLATLDTSDLQNALTRAEQSYLLQQLTYSMTLEPEANTVATAKASYTSALAAYQSAQTDYANLATKESVQCSALTTAKASLDRAQTAYDRLANDHQASQYLNGDWGPYQHIVDGLENAQDAYNEAVSNCNITKLNLNDSALRSAQAQVQSAKTTLDNLTSPRTEKQIQAAAALEQARLSLEQARRDLADAQIVAPFDGIITAVNITAGETGGANAITLADVSQLHVDVLVDETEIANVRVGQAAELTLDAVQGITLTGTVARIDPVGTVSNGVVNYGVRVNLDASTAALKLDMTANASLVGEKAENVLVVPTTAIRTARTQSTSTTQTTAAPAAMSGNFVLVLTDGQPRPVPVTLGMTANDYTEISGDVAEGDLVVINTSTSSSSDSQEIMGPPDGGLGGPPPDGGAGGPPPGF